MRFFFFTSELILIFSVFLNSVVLRLLLGSSEESDLQDRRGCRPAAGPPAQPAEHHPRCDPETRPPHPPPPTQGAADPAVCHRLSVRRAGPQGPGNLDKG